MARRGVPAERVLRRAESSESSSSDDEFEAFLSRMKTPKAATCCTPRTQNSSSHSKENFCSYLTSKYGSAKKGARPLQRPPGASGKEASPAVSCFSPLVFSDTDSDDSVFVGDMPRSARWPVKVGHQKWSWRRGLSAPSQKEPLVSRVSPDSYLSEGDRCSPKENSQNVAQILRPKPSIMLGSSSSEEEIDRLIVRVKQRMVMPAAESAQDKRSTKREQSNSEPSQKSIRTAAKSEDTLPVLPKSPGPARSVSARVLKSEALSDVTQSSRVPMRSSCQVQGCFLEALSDPESLQVKHFQRKKEELAQNLYAFYNLTVFEQKLPESMEIVWNKKMRKTAGYCVTGQLKDPEGKRYARIMLAEKVCDSADRLRDTLIHELCHAAVWLLHGVRDGHGRFWSLYAKKSVFIHPELPVVSRCHNYEIKYKFTYECAQCQNTFGRHSKSLDTQRFVCALCKGKLVLRQPTRKDGAPAKVALTPFAQYVKGNYASARRAQQGLAHGAIMKKLSVDFAAQARLHSS